MSANKVVSFIFRPCSLLIIILSLILAFISENYILINSKPTYEWAGEQYHAMNLDLNNYKYILVKNPMNYRNLKLSGRTKYHRIDESGPTPINVEELPFTKSKEFFPKNLEEKMVIRQYF